MVQHKQGTPIIPRLLLINYVADFCIFELKQVLVEKGNFHGCGNLPHAAEALFEIEGGYVFLHCQTADQSIRGSKEFGGIYVDGVTLIFC